jgi:hypothetical protein
MLCPHNAAFSDPILVGQAAEEEEIASVLAEENVKLVLEEELVKLRETIP